MDRLKSHQEFVAVLRKRRKYSGRDIVAHYLVRSDASPNAGERSMTNSHASKRLGLAVSKAVGNAVTRNTVKRRFRVAAAKHEHRLPDGCDVVLRAKPSAATASFASLDDQIESAFTRIGQHPEGRPKSARGSHRASESAGQSAGKSADGKWDADR